MSLQGIRKAAILLMDLPPGSAAELLRSAKPDVVTRILAELAYLQNQAPAHLAAVEPVREFSTLVAKHRVRDTKGELVQQLIETSVVDHRLAKFGQKNGLQKYPKCLSPALRILHINRANPASNDCVQLGTGLKRRRLGFRILSCR